MKRTDTHSPSNFTSPDDYFYVDTLYQGTVNVDNFMFAESWRAFKAAIRETVGKQGFKGNWLAHHTCDHCGTNFSYGAVFKHIPTGDFIVVGHTCADDTFGPSYERQCTLRQFKSLISEGRARNRREAVAEKFINENPGLREALALADKHHIIQDLKAKLFRYGPLSTKQVELALKIRTQFLEREERERQEALEPKVPVQAGTRVVSGKVLATKVQDGNYGQTYKMLVKLATGEKVWGSIPSDLITNDGIQALRGKDVAFTATFEVSDRDPCFGFFKRPRKAQLVATAG